MNAQAEKMGEFTDECPPKCPRRGCGKFMSTSHDEYGMPGASCVCGATVGASFLIDEGYYEET